jgi:hypothetical protein
MKQLQVAASLDNPAALAHTHTQEKRIAKGVAAWTNGIYIPEEQVGAGSRKKTWSQAISDI